MPLARIPVLPALLSLLLAVPAAQPLLAQGSATPEAAAAARPSASVAVMPIPASASAPAGDLVLEPGLVVELRGFNEPRLERARDRFLAELSRRTGSLAWTIPQPGQHRLVIQTAGPSAAIATVGEDESYHLAITADAIELRAPNPLGVLHGLQTLLQLVRSTPAGWAVPVLTVDDRPRFTWRGLMIDSGRHFIPVAQLEQNLDLMEAVKLNVFHWHLSEDQGFRIESRAFPLLQERGSDGRFYTQAEVREILAYARDRGIRVVPEFDMPGHATAWFVGYPQLASGPGPFAIERRWGVMDTAMDPTRESTYTFLARFFAEMTALFPDPYFHIGGDECNGKAWDRNPRIQEYMRAHGLKNNAALQAMFTARVQRLVAARGKIAVGWDEVLQPGTPRDVVIQSWRGQDALAAAARAGNRGLLSWGYYLDLNEPASQHYAVDPLDKSAATLSPEQQSRILGGEAAMWTEYIDAGNLTARIWPRAAAVAERLWSPRDRTDAATLYSRLETLLRTTVWHGLPPVDDMDVPRLQRIAGSGELGPLTTLARVVEPPKEYTREELRAYTAFTPLNRLVDVVPAESARAREFNRLAGRIAEGTASPAEIAQARAWLGLWRGNDALLAPQLGGSDLSAELTGVSAGLSRAAALGLTALDQLENRKSSRGGRPTAEELAELKKLEAPQAVLLDAIVPGVETLVRAAGAR